MLSPTIDTIRLFLHILAASVWVGGQIVLAGLVPRLKRAFPGAPQGHGTGLPAGCLAGVRDRGRDRFVEPRGDRRRQHLARRTRSRLFLKIPWRSPVAAAAFVHQIGQSRAALAIGGAIGLLAALGAMFLGLLLTTGT